MAQPKADLLQGTLDMLILKALSLGPLHGYGVIQRIRQLSDELLEVEQGSLYPAVYRIEQRGWISSKWGVTETGRRAKFYTLTKAGSKQLKAEEERWDRLALAIAKVRKAVYSPSSSERDSPISRNAPRRSGSSAKPRAKTSAARRLRSSSLPSNRRLIHAQIEYRSER